MAKQYTGLGRGLSSLLNDNSPSESPLQTIRIGLIEPKQDQPRKSFDDDSLTELASSIAANGLIQPIVVRPLPNGRFQIVAGERRWRASKMAGISEIPVIIKEIDDQTTAKLALIENIQREDLNPIEEAFAFSSLMNQYGLTQENLSESIGKSRSAIANAVRLLDLPEEVLEMVKDGTLSAGHARALLAIKNNTLIVPTAKQVASNNLSVRDLEKLVKKLNKPEKQDPQIENELDYAKDLSYKLQTYLGRKVIISDKSSQKSIQLFYEDNEDLEEIIEKLCGEEFASNL